MKSTMKTLAAALLSLPVLAPLASPAAEPPYPSRPIRIIVPFAPGAATDIISRLLGQKMTETWGQQVVVDNRGGAGGNIGMGLAANAAGDGYTILFVSSSLMVNPGLYRKIPYDPFKSFVPISNLSASPHVFFAHPSLPVKSMGDLIQAVVKGMGLKKGEKVERLRVIRITDVRRESLGSLIGGTYTDRMAKREVIAEGFPNLSPRQVVEMFCEHNGCTRHTVVTRIEFGYL